MLSALVSRFTVTVIVAFGLTPALSRAGDKMVYQIGMPRSAFRDVPAYLLAFAGTPFQELMKDQSGYDGEILMDMDAVGAAKALDEGKLHLAVFQGHEYAWARTKYPTLLPLVCVVERPKEVQALLLVHHDNKATRLSELRERRLAIATMLKDHARLFLEKQRMDEMGGEKFKSTEAVTTVHDAIHKVIGRDADLTVSDFASWSYFKKLYPGLSENVKVLARSESFPRMVIAYKKDAIDPAILKKFREGFLTAHETKKGARIMTAIRIERFETVPDEYDAALKACLKAYPTPLPEK